MDEADVNLTGQEARDLVFLLLDAVDIADGEREPSITWFAHAWEAAQMLLDRLYADTEGGS